MYLHVCSQGCIQAHSCAKHKWFSMTRQENTVEPRNICIDYRLCCILNIKVQGEKLEKCWPFFFSFFEWVLLGFPVLQFYFGNFLGTKATNVPIFPPLVITSSLLPSPVMEVGDSKWGLMLVTKMKNVVLLQIDHGKRLYSYFPLVDSKKKPTSP